VPNHASRRLFAFSQSVNVSEILRPPGGNFCGDEISTRNKEGRKPALRIDNTLNPPFPRDIKIDAVNTGKNIEPVRIYPKSEEICRIRKILNADVLERRAKRSQCVVSRPCVFCIRFYEKVKISREARLRVKDNRITADNQVSNAVRVEGG
jgi:hypothetical protein